MRRTAFKPKIVYPCHYRGSDLKVFAQALESHPDIEVRLRDRYQRNRLEVPALPLGIGILYSTMRLG